MKSITKRDVKVFILGVLTMIVIEVVYDWGAHVQAFKDGFAAGLKGEYYQSK